MSLQDVEYPENEQKPNNDVNQTDQTVAQYTVKLLWSEPVNFVDLLYNADYEKCRKRCEAGRDDNRRQMDKDEVNIFSQFATKSDESIDKEFKDCIDPCKGDIKGGDKIIGYVFRNRNNESSEMLKPLRNRIFTTMIVTDHDGEETKFGNIAKQDIAEPEVEIVKLDTNISGGAIWSDCDPVRLRDIITLQGGQGDIDGKSYCDAIKDATNQSLRALDYTVNGKSNPKFVEAECIDAHAVVDLMADLNANPAALNLLRDEDFEEYCERYGTKNEGKLMIDGQERQVCNPVEVPGRIFGSSTQWNEVNENERDKIKHEIKKKVNRCFAKKGCSGGYAIDTSGNFKEGPNSFICCREVSSIEKQVEKISKSDLDENEKHELITNLKNSEVEVDKELQEKFGKLDSSTKKFLIPLIEMIQHSLRNRLEETVDSNPNSNNPNPNATIYEKIKNFASILNKYFWKFIEKGFNVISYILEYPKTIVWIVHVAKTIKDTVCEMVSIRLYGQGVLETGVFGKTQDFITQHYSTFKKAFISAVYEYVMTADFQNHVSRLASSVSTGLTAALNFIPGVGPLIAGASGFALNFICQLSFQNMSKFVLLGIQTIMYQESVDEVVQIVTGTCIKHPINLAQVTLGGQVKEIRKFVDGIFEYVAPPKVQPPNPLGPGIDTSASGLGLG